MSIGRIYVMPVLAMLLGVMLGGCAGKPEPQVVTYRRGTTPSSTVPAAYDGRYLLIADGVSTPDASAMVEKGDPIGFARKSDDSIVAVAGGREFPLVSRLADSYSWRSVAPEPPPDTAPATQPTNGAENDEGE